MIKFKKEITVWFLNIFHYFCQKCKQNICG